ncbi:TIGR02186 family protein [Mameliella alba]|nr:TIGR02186 family protein [Antarctobacter heliothermus]MBY6144978.1 TIGR02186 family protein [Mameliella alba]MBY6160496.1 TIGR02186 family protein [Mameliella alba]MBY6168966.1 TIGR02186 family protein [Mameliella alba]MBY6173813.1 TIGR02186 family protein [Mameliella alba]
MRLFLLLLMLTALPARAEQVVLGLSKDIVQISTNFDGSEILIFGAIKRETPIDAEPLQVIVAVAGPQKPLTVWRQARRMGIWVNAHAVEVDSAPSFYAIATSAPWDQVISDTEDLRHKVSIPRAIRSVGAPMDVPDAQSFTEAVIRIRTDEGTYQLLEDTVTLREQTLFDTAISMPANLTEGTYPTRIYLTRGGTVISTYETEIEVRKVGLERWLYGLSRNQPFLYGLMSLFIAIAAGWGASTAFRILRSQ